MEEEQQPLSNKKKIGKEKLACLESLYIKNLTATLAGLGLNIISF